VAEGKPLPEARVPVWIDVRDLAKAHVEALLRPEVGGKRYVPAAPDKFSYELAASIIKKHFPATSGRIKAVDEASVPTSYDLDGQSVSVDLGVNYHDFETTVVDLFNGLASQGMIPCSVS
jgi:nucleoside-diphosphate-sugar epimerase